MNAWIGSESASRVGFKPVPEAGFDFAPFRMTRVEASDSEGGIAA